MTELTKILDEIRVRTDSASKGPWRREYYPSGSVFVNLNLLGNVNMREESTGADIGGPYGNPQEVDSDEYQRERIQNADFIAASRTDVDRLEQVARYFIDDLIERIESRHTNIGDTELLRERLWLVERIMNGEAGE